ncbi:MAG: hypothetical protein ACRDCB_13530 [Clostridium sp.]
MEKLKKFFKSFEKIENLYIYIFFCIFIFSDFFRRFIIGTFITTDIETIYNVNYLFVILMGILILKFRDRIDKKYTILILILFIIEIIQIILGIRTIKQIFLDCIFIFLPLLLFSFKLSLDEGEKVVVKSIKILNIFVFVVLAIGIVDYLTNRGVQNFLNYIGYYNSSYSEMITKVANGTLEEPYRYISIFGHPLRNAQLFISFYILNFLSNKNFYKWQNFIAYTLTMLVGCIISNGKTAIVIAIFLSFYSYFYKYRKISIKQILAFIVGLVIIVNTKMFKDTIMARFREAIVNKDLTSGRNVIFKLIGNGQVDFPKFFGHGEGMSNYIILATNQNIASLEYPFMVFFFDKGIAFTLILYLILALPLIELIKMKQYNVAFMYLIFNGYVNIYNGIAINGDYLVQYVFINILIYYIGKFKKERWG